MFKVQLYGKFPVGVPIVQLGDEILPLGQLFGFLKCRILAPKKMYIVPLANSVNGKLQCVLCSACAEKQMTTSCKHSDNERALIGTWTTPELELAVSQGYKILESYESWHFTQSKQYKKSDDPNIPSEMGLFGGFITNFLHLKTMASGPPRPNMTPAELQTFCDEFTARFNVPLNPTLLEFNAVQRSTTKLILNSICKY